jgi:anti-sigma regulatory factor (Ser/Thr protein kinase)
LNGDGIILHFDIPGDDFSTAGEASSGVKKMLHQLGINPAVVKKASIAMYEAEINAVIHAGGGAADIDINGSRIVIVLRDHGPGIPDIDLAMQEGYSTAPDNIREMGFGAGMGLPNMKRYSDNLEVQSEVGKGTTVTIMVLIPSEAQ